MPVPSEAFKFGAEMDPAEILDYKINLRNNPKLLEATEQYASWTLTFYPEAIALGLEIGVGAYAPIADGINLTVWFNVNATFQDDPAYDGSGFEMPMELSIVTNNNPARKRQRTILLPVKQL